MSLCSVRERLRRTPLSDAVVRRIRALGLGRERGGAVRLSDEQLREGRRRELGRMGLIQAAATLDELPRAAEAELALAGRSNVGKSSLLNALVGKRSGGTTTRGLAPVQNRPGVTRSLNFYGSERRGARIVDMPGYGFAFASDGATAQWQAAMREFVVSRGGLLRVLLCVDARQSLRALDRDFLLMLDREAGVPCLVVMTKCDLVPTSELARRFALLEADLAELGLRGLRAGVHMAPIPTSPSPSPSCPLSAHPSAHASSPVPRRSARSLSSLWPWAGVEPHDRGGARAAQGDRAEMPKGWLRFPRGGTEAAEVGGAEAKAGDAAEEEAEAGAEPLGRTARRQRAKVAAVARLSQRVAAADAWARRKSRLSEQERSSRGRSRRRRQFGG
eukprot:CAMPEP_0185479538 /NCGR_PEP_ID=MMETSP1366-20130426/5571_1 /TAXON_ID=38817 /ORGANISM="Gephyrocapsa oceanica, Strain RCC1303" /LENGTH=388 /DNA_ID=CAMNT_0028086949 /DNA_START=39 /DNA_END=1206 /DNA_ORIENTATION=-